MIVFRRSERPIVVYEQADDPIVFHQLQAVYVAGAYLLDPITTCT